MRLLLIEDEKELAALTAQNLARHGLPTDLVATVEEAETALRLMRYDAVLLDLGLPDGDGLDLLRRLRRGGSTVPVLALTARDGVEQRVVGLEAGADDYIIKPFAAIELAARIKAVLRRPRELSDARLESGNVILEAEHGRVEVGGRPLALTRREFSLLAMLMRNENRTVTRTSLADDIYGLGLSTGPNALEVAVHRLRRHLEQAGATVSVDTVRGHGYRLASRP